MSKPELTDDQIRIALAELRGWVWYRTPNPGKRDREHRMLAHPHIHEYQQSPEWLVRADGSERQCGMDYMEREGQVPKLDHNTLADARAELLTTAELQSRFCYTLTVTILGMVNGVGSYAIINATPRQQALALLRVFGKEI